MIAQPLSFVLSPNPLSTFMERPKRSCRTRKRAAKLDPTSDDETAEDDHLEVKEKEYRPNKKRARCAAKDERDDDAENGPAETPRKRAKRAGKLARLQEMPLDVLFDVRAAALLDASTIAHPPV
jgi:hypothetical protein